MTETIVTPESLRNCVAGWRQAGEAIALVPTMGALHEGHRSLVRLAKVQAKRVIVSIFVNPAQFGPNEDFSRYPRLPEKDIALLAGETVDAVYMPDVATMYPEGFSTRVQVDGLGSILCGAFRPGHFEGVATVVAKLFNQAVPDVAIFGEKDFQQLAIIRRMARDLDFPIEIVGAPIVREEDGLALSSRNRYLSEQERAIAPELYRTLLWATTELHRGAEALAEAKEKLLAAGFASVDYLELRDTETLASLEKPNRPARLLAAAWLGSTRLIDNIEVRI